MIPSTNPVQKSNRKKSKKRRQVPVIVTSGFSILSLGYSLSADVKEFIIDKAIFAIQDALECGSNEAELFELDFSGEILSIPKSEWKNTVQRCISFLEENENYEVCAKYAEILKKL